jgi:6-phosphofructokinase
VDWVAALPFVDRSDFRHAGQSQGGAFGIILAALNRNLTRAQIGEPAVTDISGYLADRRQSGWPLLPEKFRGKPCYENEPMSAVRLASVLKRMCGMVEVRATVIGYIQRGAEPTARDSAFAFEAGNLAVRLLRDGISNQVIGMQKGRVMYMPIEKALSCEKNFNRDLFNLVNSL